jgi:hypothetical protein
MLLISAFTTSSLPLHTYFEEHIFREIPGTKRTATPVKKKAHSFVRSGKIMYNFCSYLFADLKQNLLHLNSILRNTAESMP